MKKSKTKAELEIEVKTLRAQMHCHLYGAHKELKKVCEEKFMASGIIVTITTLSGKEIVTPFMCVDGLSDETIKALQKQIEKTVELSNIHKCF